MISRKSRLSDKLNGLKGDIFLHWNKTGTETWPLKQRPIYGPANMTQAELFAAVAHSLQVMRDWETGELSEFHTPPIAKFLDPKLWLIGRFYDHAITACIIRAARRHDIRASVIETELEKHLKQRLVQKTSSGLRSELLFAIAMNKFPMPDKDFFKAQQLLEGEEGVSDFLRKLLYPQNLDLEK